MLVEQSTLVLRAADGDVEAFRQLVSRYANAVYSVVLSKVGDVHTAEDVAQDVFTKIWINLNRLEDPDKFGGWAISIARNQAVDWLRKSIVVQPFIETDAQLNVIPSTEDEVIRRENLRTVHAALNRLGEKYKLVVVMYYLSGFNTREISKLLGISLSAVESRLRRSKEKLKKELLELAEQTLTSGKLGQDFTQNVIKRISGLACIKLPVSNLERSVQWYVDHLGCLLMREPDQWREAVIQFGVSGPVVLLFEQSDSNLMTLHFTHNGEQTPIFELIAEDIDGFHAQLKKEGVNVADIYENECGVYFQVFDPDQYRITIVYPKRGV